MFKVNLKRKLITLKMRTCSIGFLICFFQFMATGQQTQRISLYNDRFSFLITSDYTKVEPMELNKLFPIGSSKPDLLYRSSDKDITFALTLKTDQKVSISTILTQKTSLVKMLRNNSSVSWITDDVEEINGKSYLVCIFNKFMPSGQNSFNKIFFTSFMGNLLVGTFSINGVINEVEKSKMNIIFSSFKIGI